MQTCFVQSKISTPWLRVKSFYFLLKKKASQKWCFFDSQIDHVIICIILCDRLNLFLTDLGNHNVGTEVWIWLSGFLSTVYLNNLIAWKVILRAALSSYLLGERHCCRFSSNWKSLILISVRGACENMIKYRGIRHTVYWHSSMGSFCSSVIQPTLGCESYWFGIQTSGYDLVYVKKEIWKLFNCKSKRG